MKLQVTRLMATMIVCTCAATSNVAQQIPAPVPQNGGILGTVLDVKGGTVPGASVTLQGPSPNDRRTAVAQENGFFKFDGLKPGTPYRVVVSAKGLANWNSNAIILKPGQFLILNRIALRIPTLNTTVNAVDAKQVAVEQVHVAESQRILSVIPNFYVTYDQHPVPLTAKLKFRLAMKALTDPVTIAGFGINAGIYQAFHYPDYQLGAKGYGQRLGATFVGGYTNILIGDALLPSLLHQDPRYFYQGTGTTRSRLWHAISSALITPADNGSRQFNYSGIVGDLASGAIANAYYPSKDRGPRLVLNSTLIGIGGRMAEGVVQEFVLRKITSRRGEKKKSAGH